MGSCDEAHKLHFSICSSARAADVQRVGIATISATSVLLRMLRRTEMKEKIPKRYLASDVPQHTLFLCISI